ncbi:MAG: hypothetical protein K6G28_04905 [Acholeplasmatales bacterium]|nr:hypothetical protein [Acholeplasmatales bacterium]
MVAFSRYYIDFLNQLWKNIRSLIVDFLFGFWKKLFYTDQKNYYASLQAAAWNNAEWTALDWIALVGVTIVNITLVVLIVLWLIQWLRRYLRFRKREVEKDDLVQEVAILNQKVIELIDEKNKILALRVSQIGGGVVDNRARHIDTSEVVGKKKTKKVLTTSRFTKLIAVDEQYQGEPEYTVIRPEDMLDLPGLIDRFIKYAASQLHLFYTKEIVARYFAGMGTSKVLILEGISGTGKTSLPYAMGKFFNRDASIISVQPSWRDRTELLGYLNEFTKKFNETDFLQAVYAAGYSDKPTTIVLDEMNLARIEYYFAEFLSVMEMPDKSEWKIDLVPAGEDDPKLLINGKLLINQNTYFIGTANKDDSTYTITDKVYDRALPIVINQKADYIDAPFTENVNLTFEYLDELFKKAQAERTISNSTNESFKILDDFIQEKFKIAFGNRIKKQINLFVPVYMACGYSELDGLDYMLCNKILRKFEALNLTFLQNELDELYNKLDELFGVGAFKVSQAYILDLKKMI